MSKSFSIGEAARLTGTSIKQLRYWQERGYIPLPETTKCGQRSYRYYTQDHISFLKLLKAIFGLWIHYSCCDRKN